MHDQRHRTFPPTVQFSSHRPSLTTQLVTTVLAASGGCANLSKYCLVGFIIRISWSKMGMPHVLMWHDMEKIVIGLLKNNHHKVIGGGSAIPSILATGESSSNTSKCGPKTKNTTTKQQVFKLQSTIYIQCIRPSSTSNSPRCHWSLSMTRYDQSWRHVLPPGLYKAPWSWQLRFLVKIGIPEENMPKSARWEPQDYQDSFCHPKLVWLGLGNDHWYSM